MKYIFIILSFVMLISGCASERELRMGYDAQLAAVQAQAAREQQATLTVKCGESSDACKGLDLTYIDPRDRNTVVIPKVTNSNDALIEFGGKTIDGIVSIGKWGIGVWGVSKVADSLGNGETNISTTINGDGNTTTPTAANNIDTNSNIEDQSVNDSNNDSSNNSDNSDNSAVATPTIVNQPAPTIVDPVVVNQPAPTIVDPVVVNPEVVNPQIVNPIIVNPSE